MKTITTKAVRVKFRYLDEDKERFYFFYPSKESISELTKQQLVSLGVYCYTRLFGVGDRLATLIDADLVTAEKSASDKRKFSFLAWARILKERLLHG